MNKSTGGLPQGTSPTQENSRPETRYERKRRLHQERFPHLYVRSMKKGTLGEGHNATPVLIDSYGAHYVRGTNGGLINLSKVKRKLQRAGKYPPENPAVLSEKEDKTGGK